MSIIKETTGYQIKDSKGIIHAKNIPDIRTAKVFCKAITIAREGL